MIGNNIAGSVGLPSGLVDVPFVSGTSTLLDHLNTSYYHVRGVNLCGIFRRALLCRGVKRWAG